MIVLHLYRVRIGILLSIQRVRLQESPLEELVIPARGAPLEQLEQRSRPEPEHAEHEGDEGEGLA